MRVCGTSCPPAGRQHTTVCEISRMFRTWIVYLLLHDDDDDDDTTMMMAMMMGE